MLKYNPDGSLDSTCTPSNFVGESCLPNALHLLPNGKLLISATENDDFVSLRYKQWIERSEEIVDSTCGTYNFNGQLLTSAGSYIDTIFSTSGCDSIIYLDLSITPINDFVQRLSNAVLTANESGAQYQWIECNTGSPLVGDTNQRFTATSNGNYAVIITQNGCSDTSSCFELTYVGMDEFSEKFVGVYPNPNNGSFTIELHNSTIARLHILNLQGQVVYQSGSESEERVEVNLDVDPGIYFLQIENENGMVTKKIVIQ